MSSFSGMDKDFWVRIEDLLMRKKSDYSLD
jgi:hypothetical protein